MPGAFEASFQSAPLDMFEQTFYYARKELVDKRLAENASAGMCAAVRIYMKFSAYVGFLLVIFQRKLISVSR